MPSSHDRDCCLNWAAAFGLGVVALVRGPAEERVLVAAGIAPLLVVGAIILMCWLARP